MMWGSTSLCLCAAVIAGLVNAEEQDSRLVNIEQGQVRGYKDLKSGIYAFRSIPYATAPTGPDRFKAPYPPPVWMKPLEAVDRGIICPQASFPMPVISETKSMQENCLIASVYVPDTEQNNLPVVVYVHGGAFQMGFGDMLLPKKLITEHNIIVVTFNYRLGVHGFLSLGSEDIPGNAGMKDQIALLRWVKRNIRNFGGNPDDVTIAGYSAGSAAVDLLMLSKAGEGLFNKVIPESGANIAAFTIQSDPLENAKWYAKTLNFTNVNDIYALEDFYKTLPFDVLTRDNFFDRPDSTFAFSPCVERATGGEVFLDKSPVDILKSGKYRKIPLLYGFANMEGLLRIDFFDLWKHKMNEKFSDFLPADLKFETEEQKEKIAKTIKEFYFGVQPVDENNILAYVDYFTDVIFAYPTLRSVKLHVEAGHNQIYLYEYSFVDDNVPPVPHTSVKGANHCSQTIAVAGETPEFLDASNFTEEFKAISSITRDIWANFIKTGKPVSSGSPVPSWPPVGKNRSPHMSLSNEVSLKGSLLEMRMRFWDDIYSKYYRDPVPAPAPPLRHNEL